MAVCKVGIYDFGRNEEKRSRNHNVSGKFLEVSQRLSEGESRRTIGTVHTNRGGNELGGAQKNGQKINSAESAQSQEDFQEEEKTATQVIVKPDGSRVLLVKVMVAGMETTMSIQLSEPTDRNNDCNEVEDGSCLIENTVVVQS